MPSERASRVNATPTLTRGKIHFTLAQANRAVPYVSRIVRDLTAAYREALTARERIEHPHPEDVPEQLKKEYEQTMDRLSELIDELHQVGVEIRDFERGLVDFPATFEDREISLCWHLGEREIAYWHEVDAGYAGRQDIALLKPQEQPASGKEA